MQTVLEAILNAENKSAKVYLKIMDGDLEELPVYTGGIESVSIINPGYNYSKTPTVTILGDGVGATALHNTTHVISQKAGLYINEDTNIGLKHNEVEDKPGLISLSGEYTYNGKHKITDLINEFLSAYVDVAKDDIVFDLNKTTNLFTDS